MINKKRKEKPKKNIMNKKDRNKKALKNKII